MKLFAASVMLLGFAALFVWTLGARGSGAYPLLYPQVLLGAVCLMLGVLALGEARARFATRTGGDAPAPSGANRFAWQPVAALVAAFCYVLGWSVIGHVPATAIFLVVALLIAGERRPLVLGAFAIIIPLIIQLLFIQALRIPLPRIPWL